ncbi:MAG: hypothetical protein AAB456_03405 [Patescibacteria group bacterium]
MPKPYEKMRDKFKSEGMSDKNAKAKAAAIYNSRNPAHPVTRYHNAKKHKKKNPYEY